MRGRDLHGSGAELRLRPVVGEDGDLAISVSGGGAERKSHEFADVLLVAGIVRINRNGHISQQCFGTRGGDDDGAGAVREGVADVVELAEAVFVDDFEIGDGGLNLRVPVDDVGAAIDEALLVETDEGLLDGDVEVVVHGEVFAGPIDARAQAAHLVGDGRAVLALPGPYASSESFAAEGLRSVPSEASLRSTSIWVAMPA